MVFVAVVAFAVVLVWVLRTSKAAKVLLTIALVAAACAYLVWRGGDNGGSWHKTIQVYHPTPKDLAREEQDSQTDFDDRNFVPP